MNYGDLSHRSRRPQRRLFRPVTARIDPVAEALRCIVFEKGLKQKGLAERADMEYRDVNRLLNGRKPLLARDLPQLAEACWVTVAEVYERAEELRQLMEADGERGQGGPA